MFSERVEAQWNAATHVKVSFKDVHAQGRVALAVTGSPTNHRLGHGIGIGNAAQFPHFVAVRVVGSGVQATIETGQHGDTHVVRIPETVGDHRSECQAVSDPNLPQGIRYDVSRGGDGHVQ